MTQYKTFYELLGNFADLFDTEQKQGGHDAALALRDISGRSHIPLPPSHNPLGDMVDEALSINPHPLAEKIASLKGLLDWHYSGLSDGRIREDIAKSMVTTELIGPDGMIFCEHVRVGLFAQSANVDYVTRIHAAEETFIILGGEADWKTGEGPVQTRTTGDIIHHPSNIPHVSITHDKPCIALWRWTGDIAYDKYSLTG